MKLEDENMEMKELQKTGKSDLYDGKGNGPYARKGWRQRCYCLVALYRSG